MQEQQARLLGLTDDPANPARYLPGLAAQANTLPFLTGEAEAVSQAIAAGDSVLALDLSRAMTARLTARRQEARDEARRKDAEESDAIARSLATEADLLWKGKDRRDSLTQLALARDEAASPDLRSELAERLQRRFNLVVHMRRDLGAARDLMDEMQGKGLAPNEITYSTLIAKAPDLPRALALRDEMQGKGLVPDVFTYNSLIAKAPDLPRALALRDEMLAKGLVPNEITYNSLIAKAPDFDNALALSDEMLGEGLVPDVFTYSTLIAKAPDLPRALALRDEMLAKGLAPNEVTYSTLMEKATTLDQAEPLLEAFIQAGGKPDTYHFNALLALAGSRMAGERLFRRMLGLGLRPNMHVVTSRIKSAASLTDARQIAVEFKKAGGEIDVRMMGAIMVKTRDPAILRNFHDLMMRAGPRPDRFCMQHLILSAPDKAAKLFYLRAMRDLGLEPEDSLWSHLARHDIFAEDL